MINSSDEPVPKRFGLDSLKVIEIIQKANRQLKELYSKLVNFFGGLQKLLVKEKRLAANSAVLFIIALSPWISEISVNRQIYADILKYSEPLDPLKAGELCESVGKYTPFIEENKDDIALAIMLNNESFGLSQQLSVNTDKQIAGPERQEATYTVQKGETIMQIAERFGLHVATIIDANGIAPEKTKLIQPGTVLKIPSSDTNTSSDWLVVVNKAEEEEKRKKQLAISSSRALAASSTTYRSSQGYIGVPINHNGISRGYSSYHRGIDYMAHIGTPIYAAASGRVVITSTGWSGGYGNQIVVDHGGGRATRYAHLSSIAVSPGQNVGRGQVIGYSGNTGRSTGPHLHFELIINGSPVPPF